MPPTDRPVNLFGDSNDPYERKQAGTSADANSESCLDRAAQPGDAALVPNQPLLDKIGDADGGSDGARYLSLPPSYPDLVAKLGAQVSGHRDVIRQLALLFDHRWSSASTTIRERVLIVGSSGSGKSHLVHALARCLNVPCVVVDASALSESGWQGMQPADVMLLMYEAVGRNVARLERGEVLLVMDEVDKLAPRVQSDWVGVSVRRGRQQSLLGIVGGLTPVRFLDPDDALRVRWLEARTDRIPILCAGAFPDLVMAGSAPTDAELCAYGMIPELAGRLSTRVVLESRTAAELVILWRSPDGVVSQLTRAAAAMGYRLDITDGALAQVARRVSSGTGGLTPRGGGAALGDAVRAAIIRALEDGKEADEPIVIAPDDVTGTR